MTTLQQQHLIDFQSFVFDYARGFDEARGLGRPQIATAGRDLEMWRALEGKATSSRLNSNARHSCPPPLRGGVGSVGLTRQFLELLGTSSQLVKDEAACVPPRSVPRTAPTASTAPEALVGQADHCAADAHAVHACAVDHLLRRLGAAFADDGEDTPFGNHQAEARFVAGCEQPADDFRDDRAGKAGTSQGQVGRAQLVVRLSAYWEHFSHRDDMSNED